MNPDGDFNPGSAGPLDRAELARALGAEPAMGEPRDVIVEAREPAEFMARFAEAVALGGNVFITDPAWSATERAQFNAIVASAGRVPTLAAAGDRGWLCIPTGGSSGQIKLARHDEETLGAAVRGFCEHFGVDRVNAVGLLPLHHVSGLMAWLRCALTGGAYRPWSWKAIEAGERPVVAAAPTNGKTGAWFVSLVPTQLQRLLSDPSAVAWLRGFRAVFVGGAPSWPELIEAGARARLPLAFSYGMTETAAMVAALRPEEFLAGARGCGAVLPHATVTVDEAEGGRIVIGGESLFRGYYPAWREGGGWATDDAGRFDERGSLEIFGRRDALIITGGEKVNPLEVETAIRALGVFADVVVAGMADAHWGQVVTAFFPSGDAEPVLSRTEQRLRAQLAAYKLPRRWIAVPAAEWPRNAQGKVNRAALIERCR